MPVLFPKIIINRDKAAATGIRDGAPTYKHNQIMKRLRFLLVLIAVGSFILTSCLTVEKKQYTFEITGKDSGKLTIKYINLMSDVDSAGYTEMQDFDELISSYINGTRIEESYPEAVNIQKRLFEENGMLCGEVTMDFPSLSAARLFRMDGKSPYIFYTSSVDGESYIESNGTYGGDNCPVVVWPAKTKKLVVTTSVTRPGDSHDSLLGEYKRWKNKN